jgi:hypothetical protein
MITFFTTPKAFQGHIGIIQTNALTSWSHLNPGPEVLLLGNDEGVSEAAKEFHFKHLPLETKGIPILNEIFSTAKKAARHQYLCYINSDIILLDDFMPAFEKVRQSFGKFLMVSSRWNLDIETIYPLELESNRICLKETAIKKHDVYPAGGSDFFLFPKDMFNEVPPFLLGRGYWDNWLMYQAKQEGAVLIDVTLDVIAVHQNHDYSHVKGFTKETRALGEICKAEEGKRNLQLAGGQKNIYNNYDADYVLVNNGFTSTWNLKFIFRRIKSSVRRLKLHLLSNS